MPPPPRSGLGRGKTQQRSDLNAPLTGPRRTPFHPVAYTVGRIKPRAAPTRRRRPVAAAPPPCLRHRPHGGARPSPDAAATFQHGHGGRTMIPNGAGQRRFVFPKEAGSWWRRHAGQRCQMRGRSYGPLIPHQATGRTADTGLTWEKPRRGWGGRLRDFSQPLWREPRRSWPQRRALPGRSTDCPTRRKLTGP